MKSFKLIVTLLSILMMLSTFAVNSMAAVDSTPNAKKFNVVATKKALVAQYKGNAVAMSEEEKKARTHLVEEKLANLKISGASDEKIETEMNALKVYKLNTPEDTIFTPLSQGSDVTMDKPEIYYDSLARQWIVSGGGHWNNKNWFYDFLNIWPSNTKNVGNFDSFGITYYNTSGSYNTAVKSSYGYWTDGNGWYVSTYNPSHGDGKYGVAFDFQDVAKIINPNELYIDPEDVTYLGSEFFAIITYDSNFTNYNGYARTFYVHTWDNAIINSITFGVSGKQFGIDISISNVEHSFKIFNGSDSVF